MKIFPIILIILSSLACAESYFPVFNQKIENINFSKKYNEVLINLHSDIRERDYLLFSHDKSCQINNLKINGFIFSNIKPIKISSLDIPVENEDNYSKYFDEYYRLLDRTQITQYKDSFKLIGRLEKGLYRVKFSSRNNLPFELKSANQFGSLVSSAYQSIGLKKISTDYYEFYVGYRSTKIVFLKNKEIFEAQPININIEYFGISKIDIQPLNSSLSMVSLRGIFSNKASNSIYIEGNDVNCINEVKTKTTKADWYESILNFSQWYLHPVESFRFENDTLLVPIKDKNIKYEAFKGKESLKNKKLAIFIPQIIYKNYATNIVDNNYYYKIEDNNRYNNIVVLISKAHRSAIETIFINADCNGAIRDIELNSFFNGHYYTNLDSCKINYIKYVPRVSDNIIYRVGKVMDNFSLILMGDIESSNLNYFNFKMKNLMDLNNIKENEYEIFSNPK